MNNILIGLNGIEVWGKEGDSWPQAPAMAWESLSPQAPNLAHRPVSGGEVITRLTVIWTFFTLTNEVGILQGLAESPHQACRIP